MNTRFFLPCLARFARLASRPRLSTSSDVGSRIEGFTANTRDNVRYVLYIHTREWVVRGLLTSMERLRKKLSEYDQEHLLRFWEELTDEERCQLENDIDEFDLREIMEYFKKAVESSQHIGHNILDDKMQPIDETKIASVETSTEEELNTYEEHGLKEIAQGHVAVLLLAGGQGSRLGVIYPKGMYDVALPSHKTLFQLQAERILRLQNIAQQRHGKPGEITWYVIKNHSYIQVLLYTKRKEKIFQNSFYFLGISLLAKRLMMPLLNI